jgi:hypothetical protein
MAQRANTAPAAIKANPADHKGQGRRRPEYERSEDCSAGSACPTKDVGDQQNAGSTNEGVQDVSSNRRTAEQMIDPPEIDLS